MFADDNSELEREFGEACLDPHGYDNSFVAQRVESGFANFGYDPTKAHEMREKELARIAKELEEEVPEYEEYDEDENPLGPIPGEDYPDRFDDSVSLPPVDENE